MSRISVVMKYFLLTDAFTFTQAHFINCAVPTQVHTKEATQLLNQQVKLKGNSGLFDVTFVECHVEHLCTCQFPIRDLEHIKTGSQCEPVFICNVNNVNLSSM